MNGGGFGVSRLRVPLALAKIETGTWLMDSHEMKTGFVLGLKQNMHR